MSRHLVSVLMAVREPRLDHLRSAVESIVAQTHSELEVLVVEQPMTFAVRELIRSVGDDRLRHLSPLVRASLVAQRNFGLANARGDFIAVLDADDLAAPPRLDIQVHFLNRHSEVALVGTQVSVIDTLGRLTGRRDFPLGHVEIVRSLRRLVPLCHSSVMYRKAAVERAGGYSDRFGDLAEDYELYCRLARAGARLANLPDRLTRYRFHGEQLKATHLRETIRAVLRIKRAYWWRSMDAIDRLQMAAEHVLLFAPQHVVTELVRRAYYRAGSDAAVGIATEELSAALNDAPALVGGGPR